MLLAILDVVRIRLWTYGADTGTFVQVVLDAFGGMRDGIEGGTHYRYHWSPSLVLLWPFNPQPRSLAVRSCTRSLCRAPARGWRCALPC